MAYPAIHKAPKVIITLVLDSLRRDHVGCYGYGRPTPNIDRLAHEGVLFTNATSVSSWSLPSYVSMLTGLEPDAHGVNSDLCVLPQGPKTLPEVLSASGFLTGLFSANPFLGKIYGTSRGFNHILESYVVDETKYENPPYPSEPAAGAHVVFERMLGWIRENRKSQTPLFAMASLMETHTPCWPPAPFRLKYISEVDGFSFTNSFLAVNENPFRYITGLNSLSEAEKGGIISLYDGAVSYLDHLLGIFVDNLASCCNIQDEVIIFILSDHGEYLFEDDIIGHTWNLGAPSIRIPLIIWAPGRFPAGLIDDRPVQITDIYATLLGLTGLEKESYPETSVDLFDPERRAYQIASRGVFQGEGLGFRMVLKTIEHHPELRDITFLRTKCRSLLRSLIEDGWQLLWDSEQNLPGLYCWSNAVPNENLASRHEDRLKRMVRLMEAHIKRVSEGRGDLRALYTKEEPGFDFLKRLEEMKVFQQLRHLGYVD